jgi:hypothetical protein
VILATRIDLQAGTVFEVTGAVADLDAAVKRFHIVALTVDYSAAQLDDLPGGAPANGLVVEAKGTLDASGVLHATRVEGKARDMQGDDNDEGELEGAITRFVSATDFDVNGQRVTTNAQTQFEHGTSADLALDVRVEVEGSIANGVLVARKIEFKEQEMEGNLRVTGPVGTVDAAAGTFTVIGVTVQTSNSTRFEDHGGEHMRTFNVAALHAGDFVEVRGTAGSVANSIAAARVEREDQQDRVELRGIASNVAAPQLTILGVTVTSNSSTEFENEQEAPITAEQFFAQAPGKLVSAKGQINGTTLLARTLELEGEDDHGSDD